MFLVSVMIEAESSAEAEQIMAERIGYDEEYEPGSNYKIWVSSIKEAFPALGKTMSDN